METIGLFSNIDLLKKFFWNYTQEDIQELCKDYRFAHFWHYKRQEYPDITQNKAGIVETYAQLWFGYIDYFPDDVRLMILQYAKNKYQQPKQIAG